MIKKGFTLAEVLITLAVLGIVAALTIPAVIGDVLQKQYSAGYRKTLKDMNELIEKVYINDTKTMTTFTQALNNDGSQKYQTWGDLIQKNMNVQRIDRKNNIYLTNGIVILNMASKKTICGDGIVEAEPVCTFEIDVNGDAGPNAHSTGSLAQRNLKLQDRFFVHITSKEALPAGAPNVVNRFRYANQSNATIPRLEGSSQISIDEARYALNMRH